MKYTGYSRASLFLKYSNLAADVAAAFPFIIVREALLKTSLVLQQVTTIVLMVLSYHYRSKV